MMETTHTSVVSLTAIKEFPFLTDSEFAIAAKYLYDILEHALIEVELRALDPGLVYIVVRRTITLQSSGDLQDTDDTLELDEELDAEYLPRRHHCRKMAQVEYNIVRSPTYSVPALYFNMTIGSTPASLDEIYKYLLMSSEYRTSVESVGIMGAISQGDHPVHGLPYWFIHPCHTAEAMQEWAKEEWEDDDRQKVEGITLKNYLQIWLGIIGGCVGLYLPVEAMASQQVE